MSILSDEELKELSKQTKEEIFGYIKTNPNTEKEILSFLKSASIGKIKDKFYPLQILLQEARMNKNGVGALLEEKITVANKNSFNEIDISLLVENPFQPRLEISSVSVEELASSIKKDGLQSPIKISPIANSNKYYIVFGHRRVEAMKHLGEAKIKCIIENLDNSALRRLALIENIQREDLNLIEKAISYKNSIGTDDFPTQKDLALGLGIAESKVSETMSILKLDERILDDLKKNKSTKDVTALSLLNKISEEKQFEIYTLFVNKEIDREGIKTYINTGEKKNNSQCEFSFKNNKLQLSYKPSIKNKAKRNEFQKFADEATKKLIEMLKIKEKELAGE